MTASGVIDTRWIEIRANHPRGSLVLASFYAGLIWAAVFVTYKFYDHVYRIGGYIEVVYEQCFGWHHDNRHIGRFLQNRDSDVRRGIARATEPCVLAIIYGFLSAFASGMIACSYFEHVWTGVLVGLCSFSVLMYFCCNLGFVKDRRQESWPRWWAEYYGSECVAQNDRYTRGSALLPLDVLAVTLICYCVLLVFVVWLVTHVS